MNERQFERLTDREVLGLAVQIEQSNARRFRAFADAFRGYDDEVTARFEELAAEEDHHERQLKQWFAERFGDSRIPLVDEMEIDAVIEAAQLDDAEAQIFDEFEPIKAYEVALRAELWANTFYNRAAQACEDLQLAALYRELGEMEDEHVAWCRGKIAACREAGR